MSKAPPPRRATPPSEAPAPVRETTQPAAAVEPPAPVVPPEPPAPPAAPEYREPEPAPVYVAPVERVADIAADDDDDEDEYSEPEYIPDPPKRKQAPRQATKTTPAAKTPNTTATPANGVLPVVGSRQRKHYTRLAGFGLGVAIVITGGAVSINGIINPPADATETAAIVQASVASDGTWAAYESAGREFLRAYLTYSTNPEKQEILDNQLAIWGVEDAPNWRGQSTTDPVNVTVTAAEPITAFVPSTTIPGARTAIYRVTTETAGIDERGKNTTITNTGLYGVTVGEGTDQFGRPSIVVLTPPAELVDSPAVDAPDADAAYSELPGTTQDQLAEFLKLWFAAGPDATPDANTALTPWLAPDADNTVKRGLNGALTLDRIDAVKASPDANGRYTGFIQVSALNENQQLTTRRWQIAFSPTTSGGLQIHEMWVP